MSQPYDPTRPGPRPETGEDLRDAARETRQAASEAAATAKEEAARAAETLKREGSAMLDEARHRAEGMAQEGVRAGADRAGGIARAVHRAADELEQDSPALARTVHEAAGALDGMARRLRESSPGDILRNAEDFARRQPLAFFGVAALAGFAFARFARSSSPDRHRVRHGAVDPGFGGRTGYGVPQDTMHDMSTAGTSATGAVAGSGTMGTQTGDYPTGPMAGQPGRVADEGGTPRPSTLASASLGGAAAFQQPPPGNDKA